MQIQSILINGKIPRLGDFRNSGIIGGKCFPVMLTRMKYVHVGLKKEFS